MKGSPNQTLETNCRPASPLAAGLQFGRAVHAPACVSGGSRSADRSAIMKRVTRHTVSIVFAVVCVMFFTSCTRNYDNLPIANIRQMAPFKAKVVEITVEDWSKMEASVGMLAVVWLKRDDGKRVAIGGEKATPGMVGFAKSLSVGQHYSFPQVLLDYEEINGKIE